MSLRLSAGLAQRIVDRVSPLVSCNINIMNPAGLVVAAVDPSRVGTVHEGARRVAETGSAVRIHADDAGRGVQQGVNLPFSEDGVLVGVVGITGPPEEVETVAQLVLAVVELTISAEQRQGAAEVRAARDHDFLARLVHEADRLEGGTLDAELRRVAAPWRLLAILPPRAGRARHSDLDLAVRRATGEGQTFRAAWLLGALWVLGPADALLAEFESGSGTVLMSPPCDEPRQLGASARLLRALVARPSVLPAASRAHRVEELGLEAVLAGADASMLSALAEPLVGVPHRLRRTLETFFSVEGNASETARGLGVHRNSVINQIARVHEATGRDPRDAGHAQALRVALLALRMLEGEA